MRFAVVDCSRGRRYGPDNNNNNNKTSGEHRRRFVAGGSVAAAVAACASGVVAVVRGRVVVGRGNDRLRWRRRRRRRRVTMATAEVSRWRLCRRSRRTVVDGQRDRRGRDVRGEITTAIVSRRSIAIVRAVRVFRSRGRVQLSESLCFSSCPPVFFACSTFTVLTYTVEPVRLLSGINFTEFSGRLPQRKILLHVTVFRCIR